MNSVTDKYCPLLLLPVKLWAGARLTNISIRMTGHQIVGKIYILAPVYGWDNKTFLFIGKASHRNVGCKYFSLLLQPFKWWAWAKQTNISLRKAGHKNVGKIYILAPDYGWDNKTFIFIRKAGHRIVGSLSQATVNYKIISIWKIDIVNVGLINTYNRIMILIEDILNTCPCRWSFFSVFEIFSVFLCVC